MDILWVGVEVGLDPLTILVSWMETFLKETDMSLLGCVVGFALFKLELEDRPGKKHPNNIIFFLCVKMNVCTTN